MTRAEQLRAQADKAISAQFVALAKKERGQLRYVADDPDCPNLLRLAALTEELGEIARCLHDGEGDLDSELSQLAGIALAWGVALDNGRMADGSAGLLAPGREACREPVDPLPPP